MSRNCNISAPPKLSAPVVQSNAAVLMQYIAFTQRARAWQNLAAHLLRPDAFLVTSRDQSTRLREHC